MFGSGKTNLAEIRGFRDLVAVRHQFGVAGDDQHHRKLGRDVVDFADVESAQIEFVEVAGAREADEPDPQRRTRCIVFSQTKTTSEFTEYTKVPN